MKINKLRMLTTLKGFDYETVKGLFHDPGWEIPAKENKTLPLLRTGCILQKKTEIQAELDFGDYFMIPD